MAYCNIEGCLNHAANGSLRCLHHISKAFGENATSLHKESVIRTEDCCFTPGCQQAKVHNTGYCQTCLDPDFKPDYSQKQSLAVLYPKYYKAVPKDWDSMDTYAVNILFPVDDPSGCILHARKKLLVPGVRSGGKSMRKDITEARDTLNRWLELNPE